MKKTIFMYIEIILFSVFVMCIIILGCNREYFWTIHRLIQKLS